MYKMFINRKVDDRFLQDWESNHQWKDIGDNLSQRPPGTVRVVLERERERERRIEREREIPSHTHTHTHTHRRTRVLLRLQPDPTQRGLWCEDVPGWCGVPPDTAEGPGRSSLNNMNIRALSCPTASSSMQGCNVDNMRKRLIPCGVISGIFAFLLQSIKNERNIRWNSTLFHLRSVLN